MNEIAPPSYKTLTQDDISVLTQIVGKQWIEFGASIDQRYCRDETEDLFFSPEAVIKPETVEEISHILSYCNTRRIPVIPSGARTGLSGGALANAGGLVLSTERMNKILSIDTNNLQVVVQPGVITQVLQEAVEEVGLYYPPDPASRGSCFIGGNIAESSGGPRAVKYGVAKDYVLNLQVVLAGGEVIWTGANTLKNATGYNLTQLIIGSEGTLAVVTQIVLRLIPKPQHDLLILAPFASAQKACEAVSAVFRAGHIPSAMEFMERDAIDWVCKYANIDFQITEGDAAHLLIELDGDDQEAMLIQMEKVQQVLEKFECGEVLFAEDSAQKERLWEMRRKVAEAVKRNSVYKEEDTVVPRYELPKLLAGVKEIGSRYGFKSVCYGHAGDGNLHVNIIKADMTDQAWEQELPKGIRELFELVRDLGGTISGEHGIGLVQKDYLDVVFSRTHIQLMQEIKRVFDPNWILNPGKIFDFPSSL